MQEKHYFIVCADTCDWLDLYTFWPYTDDEAKAKLKELYNDDKDSSDRDKEYCLTTDSSYELYNSYSWRYIIVRIIDTTAQSV